MYAQPDSRKLGPLMDITVAPTKKLLKAMISIVGPRSGLLFTGWKKRLFLIQTVDNYQTARTYGTLFAKVNLGDPRKHETLVCGTDGLYTGERIPEIDSR